jgi:NAD(P)-dependent dehydrogenase (short-subunit alcohol dehydrogenase family)
MTRDNQILTAGGLMLGAALLARGLRSRHAISFAGRSVLITGGSRGLGFVLARELGREGARIVIAARDAAELDRAQKELEAAGVDVTAIVTDVSSGRDAERLVDAVLTRQGRLDVLINNAGIIQVGPIEHMTLADFDQAMAIHFWGPLHTMTAAIPHMREVGGGRIVNVSSIGGKIAVPHLVPYCASKFALTGLSSAMRAELLKDNIRVTTVSPGLMRTGSPFNAWFKGNHREEFAWFAISDSMPIVTVDARRAALQIVDAARHGDAELVIGWPAKLAVLANGAAPNLVSAGMSLANGMLPGVAAMHGDEPRSGWQSTSRWAPSIFTRLSERSAEENNELPPDG